LINNDQSVDIGFAEFQWFFIYFLTDLYAWLWGHRIKATNPWWAWASAA